jgi:hypothetical protein
LTGDTVNGDRKNSEGLHAGGYLIACATLADIDELMGEYIIYRRSVFLLVHNPLNVGQSNDLIGEVT